MDYWRQSPENIYVAGHRGWPAVYPENTMASFKAAASLGVDQIETDVRVTSDGELVLIHDGTVDRTTNGTGKVNEFTLKQLRELDAGIKKDPRFSGEKIPLFGEFMDFVSSLPYPITVDIELKEYPSGGNEKTSYDVCDRVLKMVDEYGFTDRIVINTFSAKLHEYIYTKYGRKYRQHVYYPISFMGGAKIDPAEYAYCCCMFASWFCPDGVSMARKEEFDYITSRGIQTWAGASVRDEKGVDAAAERKAVLITCNNPDEILSILKRKKLHE